MSQHIPTAYPLELNVLSASPPLLHISEIEWVGQHDYELCRPCLSILMSQYEYLRLGPKSWVVLKAVKAIELNRKSANDAQISMN